MTRPGRPSTESGSASQEAPAANDAKTRILAAAGELFAKKSFESCSIREIALAAAANSALIYYYFGSKEGLLRALIQNTSDTMTDLLDGLRHDNQSTRDKLRTFLLHWIEMIHSREQFSVFLSRTLPPKGDVGDMLRERVTANVLRLATILKEGESRGEVRPMGRGCERIAMQLMLSVGSPVMDLPLPHRSFGIDLSTPAKRKSFVDDTLDLFFRGLEPEIKR